jgi:hypothetical protein
MNQTNNAAQQDDIPTLDPNERAALERLIAVALNGTGQSYHVANLLLAWWSASENGGFDPMSFRNLDSALIEDSLRLLVFIALNNCYPDALGYGDEFRAIWKMWRSKE